MITKFQISNYKIIREASCDPVPRVMFVCGPNGVGKTTLLDALGRSVGIVKDQETAIAVAPATRTWRKEVLESRWLYGNPISSYDVFNLGSSVGHYGQQFGRNIYSGTRDLWSDDDAKQLVKPLLAKLRSQWQRFVSDTIVREGFQTSAREWPNPKRL